jgi:hypothetical protein
VVTFFFGNCKNVCPRCCTTWARLQKPFAGPAEGGFGDQLRSERDTIPKLGSTRSIWLGRPLPGDRRARVLGKLYGPSTSTSPDRDEASSTPRRSPYDGTGQVVQHFYGLTPTWSALPA